MKSFHPNKDGHTEQPAGHSKPYPHAMRWPPLESKSMSISCEMEPCDNYKDLTDMELDWILANTTESIHCSTPINVASNIVSCTNSPSALPRREVAMPPALISPHCVMHTPNVGASVFSMVDTPTSLQSMPSPSTALIILCYFLDVREDVKHLGNIMTCTLDFQYRYCIYFEFIVLSFAALISYVRVYRTACDLSKYNDNFLVYNLDCVKQCTHIFLFPGTKGSVTISSRDAQ